MLPKPTWGILGILGGRAALATYNHLKFSLSSQHKEKHNPVLKTESPFLPHSMKVNVIEAKMVFFFFKDGTFGFGAHTFLFARYLVPCTVYLKLSRAITH